MKQVTFTKGALESLRKMQKSRATAIINKIDAFASGQSVNAISVKGTDFIRIRVGNWRIILDDTGIVIAVLKIAPRGDVYKNRN